MHTPVFSPADILLPELTPEGFGKYAVIACDQFTSDGDYWQRVENYVGDAPSALRMVLPEIYLSKAANRVAAINHTMNEYREKLLKCYPDAVIYIERTLPDGRIRRGIIGKIDLEAYSYEKGVKSKVAATEGTVLSRIPPRVEIRRGASLELPHVMLLINDGEMKIIEPTGNSADLTLLYDFTLMEGGGAIKGYLLGDAEKKRILTALSELEKTELPYAVGDGNHSLAAAKALYEESKKSGKEASRYALVEVVNLFDDALDFEGIHRIITNVSPDEVLSELNKYAESLARSENPQHAVYVTAEGEGKVDLGEGSHRLDIGSLQNFIDEYLTKHPAAEVDYIHGDEELVRLASKPNSIGFYGTALRKEDLFGYVIKNGVLPRKTFSMGEARGKRYYLESREI
jgi:uncharacterized protein (DUF1015 family)